MMTALTIVDARKNLADALNRAHYEIDRVQITKHDKPYAIIASPEDGVVLEELDKIFKESGLASRRELLVELAKLRVGKKDKVSEVA